MTYMSLHVFDYPEDLSAEQLEAAALPNLVVRNLSEHARKCGPYRLQDWARERGLPIHYVDNCWLRVPVNGVEMKTFFKEVLGAEARSGLEDGVVETDRYLIEAEEF